MGKGVRGEAGWIGRASTLHIFLNFFFFLCIYQNARGFDGDVIIVDEAAYVSERLLFDTILPVSDQAYSCLIMISTPSDEKNYYSQLGKMRKGDGSPVIQSELVTHMCFNCRDLPIEQAILCTHWRFLLPARKMGENEKDSLVLHDGKPHTVMRERFGIICGDVSSLFPAENVRRCLSSAARTEPVIISPSVIFIGCDPGMHKSDTAYVAIGLFREGPRLIGIGLFRNDEGPVQQKQQLHAFFNGLWDHALFQSVPVVFIPEGAPAQEAFHLVSHLQDLLQHGRRRVLVMRECAGNRLGVPINHNKKRELVFAAAALLSYGALDCTPDMVAVTNKPLSLDGKHYTSPRAFLIEQLAFQLISMHVQVKALHGGVDEHTYITGKGYNQNDDLAMAFMTVVYWSNHFMRSTNSLYTSFKNSFIGPQPSIFRERSSASTRTHNEYST